MPQVAHQITSSCLDESPGLCSDIVGEARIVDGAIDFEAEFEVLGVANCSIQA